MKAKLHHSIPQQIAPTAPTTMTQSLHTGLLAPGAEVVPEVHKGARDVVPPEAIEDDLRGAHLERNR